MCLEESIEFGSFDVQVSSYLPKIVSYWFWEDHSSKRLHECSLPIAALVPSAMYSAGVTFCGVCALKPFILFVYISVFENIWC
jgi:hypothetical protein